MQLHDTAIGRGSASLVTPIRPLTKRFNRGYLALGELSAVDALPCEGCGAVANVGAVVFAFPYGSGRRGRIWHEVCFRGGRLLAVAASDNAHSAR